MIVLATREGFDVTDKDRFDSLHIETGDLVHEEFIALVRDSSDIQPHEKPRHLWISIDFLRQALDTASNVQRASELEDMFAYAGTQGWLNVSGTHVAAHVVLPG